MKPTKVKIMIKKGESIYSIVSCALIIDPLFGDQMIGYAPPPPPPPPLILKRLKNNP